MGGDSFRANSSPTGLGHRAAAAAATIAEEQGFGVATFRATPQESEFTKHSDNMPLPNNSSVDGISTLDTIITSASPINRSLETKATENDIMLSMGEHSIRQCDLMPYWSLESNPQWSFGSLPSGNDLGFDGLDLSFLNAIDKNIVPDVIDGTSGTPGSSLSQSISDSNLSRDLLPRVDSLVQRSWHTFYGQSYSGYVTPKDAPEVYHVDEICRRNLNDRLQTRPQLDSLPSTIFLVR